MDEGGSGVDDNLFNNCSRHNESEANLAHTLHNYHELGERDAGRGHLLWVPCAR